MLLVQSLVRWWLILLQNVCSSCDWLAKVQDAPDGNHGPYSRHTGVSGRSEDREKSAERLGTVWAEAAGKTGWLLICGEAERSWLL